jgi:GNAT superfamily N-acetyltransferase
MRIKEGLVWGQSSGVVSEYPAELCRLLKRQIHQSWESYGLRRDLANAHLAPQAKIAIAIRELSVWDIDRLLPRDGSGLIRKERLEIANRIEHLAARIPTCYVAIEQETDKPCYMQWLMGSRYNDQIQSFFRGRFPVLSRDQALLENAYTPPTYRGQGIMSAAMSLIAQKAQETGARYVLTFVARDNTASLKGCAKAGFYPFMVRKDSHTLFRLIRRRRFELL